MAPGAEPEWLSLGIEKIHRIDRFAHALKNSNTFGFPQGFEATACPRLQGFFFLLSMVRRKRNDSVPVSMM
jgi:hypothetical protein